MVGVNRTRPTDRHALRSECGRSVFGTALPATPLRYPVLRVLGVACLHEAGAAETGPSNASQLRGFAMSDLMRCAADRQATRRRWRRPLALVAAAAALVQIWAAPAYAGSVRFGTSGSAQFGPAEPSVPPSSIAVRCVAYPDVPVALSSGEPSTSRVWAELCSTPDELRAARAVQLLIHGATYNHAYWDWTANAGYSYARTAAAAGIATLAYDRVGDGQSSRPVSTQLTMVEDGYVAHQLVQDLRVGYFAAVKFSRVVEVGHSLGSATAWVEASTYSDVDGVIITGALHYLSPSALKATAGDLYPANLDPRFVGSGLDSGYLTTVPGARAALFYNAADADPAVIAADEATKDTVSASEFTGFLPLVNQEQTCATVPQATTCAIDVPVLLIQGADDALFCDATEDCSSSAALLREESPYYSPGACLHTVSVPGSGHDVALHRDHWVEDAAAIAWTQTLTSVPAGRAVVCGLHEIPTGS